MKKTNIPIYIMYLWAALVLAACTGDDDAAWPEGGVPLELYAAVEGYSSANAQMILIILMNGSADNNIKIAIPIKREVSHRAGIQVTPVMLQLINNFHGTYLRRSGN